MRMRNTAESGYGHFVVFLIGLVMVLFLIGFFKTEQPIPAVTYKKILRLDCGLTLKGIEENQKIEFPFKIYGYVNECGWVVNGSIAGTAQVFDSNGQPVSKKVNLNVADPGTGYPYYFENTLLLSMPPKTDTGSLIIVSASGLSRALPVSFLR